MFVTSEIEIAGRFIEERRFIIDKDFETDANVYRPSTSSDRSLAPDFIFKIRGGRKRNDPHPNGVTFPIATLPGRF